MWLLRLKERLPTSSRFVYDKVECAAGLMSPKSQPLKNGLVGD